MSDNRLIPTGTIRYEKTSGYQKTAMFTQDSLGVAAAFSYGAAAGSGYYNEVKSLKLSRYSDSLDVSVIVEYNPKTPSASSNMSSQLRPEYRKLLETKPTQFFALCGDSYVEGIKYGGTLRASFLSTASSRTESERVSLGLQAAYKSLTTSVSGSVDKVSEKQFEEVSGSVSTLIYKEGVITELPKATPEGIGEYARATFITELNNCAKDKNCYPGLANGYIIRPYPDLINGTFQYGGLAATYIRMLAKLRDLEFMTRGTNRDFFSSQVDFTLAANAARDLKIKLAKVEVDFQGCLKRTNDTIRSTKSSQMSLIGPRLTASSAPCKEELERIVGEYKGIIVPPRIKDIRIDDSFLKTPVINQILVSNYSCTTQPASEDDCDALVDSPDAAKTIPLIVESKGAWSMASDLNLVDHYAPAETGHKSNVTEPNQGWIIRSGAEQVAPLGGAIISVLGICRLDPGEVLLFQVFDGPNYYFDNVQTLKSPASIVVGRPLTAAPIKGLHLCLRP